MPIKSYPPLENIKSAIVNSLHSQHCTLSPQLPVCASGSVTTTAARLGGRICDHGCPPVRQDLGIVEVLGWEAPEAGATDDRLLVTHGRSSAGDGAVLALDTMPSGSAAGGDADMDAVRAVTGSSDGRYGGDEDGKDSRGWRWQWADRPAD